MHAKAHATVDDSRFELDFIAVAPVVLGVADGLYQLICLLRSELADALEYGAQVLLFGGELCRAREIAPRAAAADAHEGAGRLNAIGAWLQNLGGAGAHERLAVLHDLGLDGVACHGALHKDGLAVVGVRQPVGAVGHRFYSELHIPACHSRCCSHHGSREKRPASEAFLKYGALLQTASTNDYFVLPVMSVLRPRPIRPRPMRTRPGRWRSMALVLPAGLSRRALVSGAGLVTCGSG